MEAAESLIVFLIVIVLAALFLVACVRLPIDWVNWQFKIADHEKRAGVEDSYRRTIAQILGAAAIAVTWYWTWSKDHEAREQARVQSANQQYSEMLKLLGSQDETVRAAGIYPMATLITANPVTAKEYHVPIINLLRSTIKKNQPKAPPEDEKQKVPDDVIAAIYVLGELPCGNEGLRMEELYLVGGNFKDLRGYCRAHFEQAKLFAANFSGADLTDAVFDGAAMSDWESYGARRFSPEVAEEWLKDRAWERVQYVVKFDYAKLINASFKNTSVAGAFFNEADLTNTRFEETDLSRADFQHAKNIEKAIFINNCFGPPLEPVGLPSKVFEETKSNSPCKPKSNAR